MPGLPPGPILSPLQELLVGPQVFGHHQLIRVFMGSQERRVYHKGPDTCPSECLQSLGRVLRPHLVIIKGEDKPLDSKSLEALQVSPGEEALPHGHYILEAHGGKVECVRVALQDYQLLQAPAFIEVEKVMLNPLPRSAVIPDTILTLGLYPLRSRGPLDKGCNGPPPVLVGKGQPEVIPKVAGELESLYLLPGLRLESLEIGPDIFLWWPVNPVCLSEEVYLVPPLLCEIPESLPAWLLVEQLLAMLVNEVIEGGPLVILLSLGVSLYLGPVQHGEEV